MKIYADKLHKRLMYRCALAGRLKPHWRLSSVYGGADLMHVLKRRRFADFVYQPKAPAMPGKGALERALGSVKELRRSVNDARTNAFLLRYRFTSETLKPSHGSQNRAEN